MEEHEKKPNNKKTIIAIVLLAVIGIVGGTLAYFTSQAQFQNIFRTKPYSTELTEEFDAPDNWIPGEETSKKVYVTNKGDVPVAVRISYTEEWVGEDGTTTLDLIQTKEDGSKVTAALINFPNTDDWVEHLEADGKTYFYYNKAVARDEQTSLFIDKVTFNKDIDIKYNCENSTTTNAEGKTITSQVCRSTGDTYAGATYTLTIKIETVQFDAFKAYWGTNIDIPSA